MTKAGDGLVICGAAAGPIVRNSALTALPAGFIPAALRLSASETSRWACSWPGSDQAVSEGRVAAAQFGAECRGPTRWPNPFRPAKRPAANAEAVAAFEAWLVDQVEEVRRELAFRDLACWCAKDLACHADVWLRPVNKRVGSC